MKHGLITFAIAYFIESLNLTYFYIYSGRASWKLFSLGIIDIEFVLEPLGIIFINLLTGLWVISVIFCIYYTEATKDVLRIRFLTLMGLTIFAATLVALSKNLFTMFVGYELITILTIPLVAHHDENQLETKTYAQILFTTAIVLFLPFIVIVQLYAGTTEFTLGGILKDAPFWMNHLMLLLAIFGIAKTAIFPVHRWLIAAVIAPYPISAFIHAVAVVKAGLFCLFKIIVYIFGLEHLQEITSDYNWPSWLAAFTMLYASYKAVTDNSVKHVLTYSTISQVALVLLAAFMFTPKALAAAVSHTISHSFAKITLFFVAGRFCTSVPIKNISDLRSLGHSFPAAAIFFMISSLSILGIPLLAGGISKGLIWDAVSENKNKYFFLAAIIASTLAIAFYTGKFIYYLFLKPEKKITAEKITGMEVAIALSTICLVTFPVVESLLGSILWSVL